VLRRVCLVLAAVAALAAAANVGSLPADASPRRAANAFTSVNTSVLLALLLGVLGSTGVELRQSLDAAGAGRSAPAVRRVLGAQARAYGFAGAASALVFAGLCALVALPLIQGRGLPAPDSHVVTEYIGREAVAAARLAILGVALGVAVGRRFPALVALALLLALEGIAEAYVSVVRDYGPVGALNAFSDPTHHHQLSIAAGGLIALAWGVVALLLASLRPRA
jgi:hypothetical protein